MRLVVQRVSKAKVTTKKDLPAGRQVRKVVGEIGKGLFVLLGIKKEDTEKSVELLANKLLKLRVMSDEQDKQSLAGKAGKMNLSVKDSGGEILVVSQFTLHADVSGGNRPSFINAEEPSKAKKLYELFISKLRELGIKVETGSFGDYMEIETILDGPVTILYLD